jgi:hypothetical protein
MAYGTSAKTAIGNINTRWLICDQCGLDIRRRRDGKTASNSYVGQPKKLFSLIKAGRSILGAEAPPARFACSEIFSVRSFEWTVANQHPLKGSDDLEVVANEDVVRPVDADIVDLVFAIT